MWPIIESAIAWAISRPTVAADPTPSSPLLALPAEIILLIRDEADSVTAACLSLTCKRMHAIVDPRRTLHELSLQSTVMGKAIYPSHDQRKTLLQLLVRDHSALYLCYRCLRLHKHKSVGTPGPLYNDVPELKCFDKMVPWSSPFLENHLDETVFQPSIYALDFAHVQLVLAEHRKPGSGMRIDALKMTEVVERIIPHTVKHMLTSYEPQILHGELCMHIQQWLRFSRPGMRRGPGLDPWDGTHVPLCAHIIDYRKFDATYDYSWPLSRCNVCGMEGKIEFKPHEDGFILVIDKWLNLGEGLDPHARSWRRHEHGDGVSDPVHISADQTMTMEEFETSAVKTLAERTRENEELFLGASGKDSLVFVPWVSKPHRRYSVHADYWVDQIDTRPSKPSSLSFGFWR